MIIKYTLRHSIPIGSNNTDIDKTLNVSRNLVAGCIKFHGLKDALREPECDN